MQYYANLLRSREYIPHDIDIVLKSGEKVPANRQVLLDRVPGLADLRSDTDVVLYGYDRATVETVIDSVFAGRFEGNATPEVLSLLEVWDLGYIIQTMPSTFLNHENFVDVWCSTCTEAARHVCVSYVALDQDYFDKFGTFRTVLSLEGWHGHSDEFMNFVRQVAEHTTLLSEL
jgi:hypothetical protein